MHVSGCTSMLSIKDIVPAAQNNITTQFILLDKGRVATEGQSKTCLALVADETAAVHFQFWGKRGSIEKVGEFTMTYVETPNISEMRWVPDPNNSKKYVHEAVVSPYSRIFPPML
ncbi:hypothetical protein BT93_L5620 [Corymbia citriodora subsp. variegata]|uniref:Uncharacterized protein n=1 Tax=Corymbia citriodora subsp. variegata TaxID=360336 RepID=A0A8T0CRQ3_CORYI|nr:hypothetical protein BT93_L5620 [Corymbia citriodora subsp. variegata]